MVPGVKIVVLYVNDKAVNGLHLVSQGWNYRIKRILDHQIWDEFQNLKWSIAVQSILRPLSKYYTIFTTRDIIALTWRRLSHFWRPSTWYIFCPHYPCLVAYRYSKIKQSHKNLMDKRNLIYELSFLDLFFWACSMNLPDQLFEIYSMQILHNIG